MFCKARLSYGIIWGFRGSELPNALQKEGGLRVKVGQPTFPQQFFLEHRRFPLFQSVFSPRFHPHMSFGSLKCSYCEMSLVIALFKKDCCNEARHSISLHQHLLVSGLHKVGRVHAMAWWGPVSFVLVLVQRADAFHVLDAALT